MRTILPFCLPALLAPLHWERFPLRVFFVPSRLDMREREGHCDDPDDMMFPLTTLPRPAQAGARRHPA